MTLPLRIGTRDSELAVFQANEVKTALQTIGIASELVFVKTSGDLNPEKPINQFGTTGIFTKELDNALLNNEIDVAVHSCKDLPSTLENDFAIAACLPREDASDVLICKADAVFLNDENFAARIATGSIRRKAAWLSKYPKHETVDVRGNIKTRIQKLSDNNWHGLIMANAALKRLNINLPNTVVLDWLVPSPAQGIIAVVCKKNDNDIINTLQKINHQHSLIAATVERDFLQLIEGGCTVPVGAFAEIKDDKVFLKCSVMNENGTENLAFSMHSFISEYITLGKRAYQYTVENGADKILKNIKSKT